jgi:glycine cleavage system protein P-like pyridoxal-binding family
MGDEVKTMAAASVLFERGIFVPGIRFPSVARGQARLRVTATASHTSQEVRTLAGALSEIADPAENKRNGLVAANLTEGISQAIHAPPPRASRNE